MEENKEKEKFNVSVSQDKNNDELGNELTPNAKKPILDSDSLRDYLGIQEKAKSSDPRERISFYFSQIKEYLSQNVLWQEITYFWTPKRIGLVLAFIVGIFLIFYAFSYVDLQKINKGAQYRLVPEKVSKSAAIRIAIPAGISTDEIEKRISFEPKLDGNWINGYSLTSFAFAADNQSKNFYFKPNNDLEVDRYYEVRLDLGDGKKMGVDFLAVDNPKTIAVFPDNNLEALEDSKITIMFNRPMIDSSEIGQVRNNIPIEISPKTEGDFKWMSETTVQFIPKNRLFSATNYKVKVKTGFVSLDGVRVSESVFDFKTRNLRYLNQSSEEEKKVTYNEPVRIYFNQSVNLEKTIKEIKLYDSQNKEVEFYAQYADGTGDDDNKSLNLDEKTDVTYENNEVDSNLSMADYGLKALSDFISSTIKSVNPTGNNNQMGIPSLGSIVTGNDSNKNKSIIEIYNKSSDKGDYLWDLNSNYVLQINKSYPLHGDISNETRKTIKIVSGDIISSWKTTSEKTSESSLDFFDPAGALSIRFYEDIDISKIKVNSSVKVAKIDYGKKCSSGELSLYDSGCVKVSDKKNVLINFNNDVDSGGKIEFEIDEVYGVNGNLVNKNPIKKTLTIYNDLRFDLGKVIHGNNLSTLIICSTNPLLVPDKSEYRKYIQADIDYEIFSWNQSWRQLSNSENYCSVNDFVTKIDVGFMPEKDYSLSLLLEDVFGQKKSEKKYLRTSKMEAGYITISSMQERYVMTLPEKTTLSFLAQNISSVDLKICKKTDGYSFYNDFKKRGKTDDDVYKENNEINCSKIKNDIIKLPNKYWINNYFDIDIKKYFDDSIGNYVIKISNGNYNEGKGIYSYVTVTNLAVAEKKVDLMSANENQDFLKDLKNIYWVTDIKTQNAVKGAKVKLYSNGKIVEGDTNEQGISLISPVSNMEVAVVENGDDSTVVGFDGDLMNLANNVFSVKKSYIYTDKSNYLPGETVNIKGLLRTGYDGKYQVSDNKANVYILNPKGGKISEQEIKLDEYGAFVTSIELGGEASFGMYSVCATDYNCGYFSVLEGEKSNLDMNVVFDKEEYISKDVLSMNIDANYYFGVPVEDGIVDYTVTAKNYYFDRNTIGNYNFNYIDDDFSEKFLFKDVVNLDKNGKAVIKRLVDLDELFGEEKQSKTLTFEIKIKDSFGQNTSIKKTVIVHSGESYLGVALNSYFISKNDPIGIKVMSTNTQGKVKELKNITILLNKIDWIRSGNNWEKKSTNVKKLNISVNLQGEYASNSQKLEKEGEYDMILIATDSKNNKIYTKLTFYIYGDNGNVGVQVKDNYALNLKTNKDRLRAGDPGEVIIESPYMKAKALITLERGKIFEYKVVDVVGGFYNYKFKADSSYTPNVYVSVLLQTSNPTVNFAMKSFAIDSDENELVVSLTPDKRFYGPGETVKLRVFTGKAGGGAPANVSLAVVGANYLNLNDPKKDPFIFFYNGFPLAVSTSSNIRNTMDKKASGNTKLLSEDDHNVPFLQNSYSDVAYWKGTIKTGNDGRADISFKMPDTLAYWQAEAVGITAGSKVGVAYLNFNTEKELTITSLKPKFIIPGDSFYVGVKISNQSKNKKSVKVSFSSDTLTFTGSEKEVVLNIEKGDSQSVYFSVVAPKNYLDDFHKFFINIKGDGVDEAMDQSLIVMPNTTYSRSSRSHYSNENKISESVFLPANIIQNEGNFSIRGGANLSIFLTDGLNSLIRYPYGDMANISASVKVVSKVKRTFGIDNPFSKFNLSGYTYGGKETNIEQLFETALVRVSRSQNSDGGFSLFGGDNSEKYISFDVLEALAELEAGGELSSDDQKLSDLSNYVNGVINSNESSPDEKVSAAFSILSTSKYKKDKAIKKIISELGGNNDILQKMSVASLSKLAILFNSEDYGWGLKEKVNNILDKMVINDGRGEHIKLNDNTIAGENTIVDTALYLDSIVVGRRDKNTDDLIGWLLNSRESDGSWGSVKNTAVVIDSFIDYINWKKENNVEYYASIKLNGNDFDGYQFNPERVFDQVYKKVSIDNMNIGSINSIDVDKSNHRALFKDLFYYDIALKYNLQETATPKDEGFAINRSFYPLNSDKDSKELNSSQSGEVLRVHLEVVIPYDKKSVLIEDFIPAGMEILDVDLVTDQKSLRSIESQVKSNYLYPNHSEIKNDRVMIYKKDIKAGVYEFDYHVRSLIRGRYLNLPAVIKDYDNPYQYGQTASSYFEIK